MIVIGELVNATRKKIKKAVQEHDADHLAGVIQAQAEAGAHYIDLNAGTGSGSSDQEVSDMKWLIDLALDKSDKKLTIDSADPAVIRAAAEHLGGRREWMLNSIKGTSEALDSLLPLVKEHDVPFVALAMDESGIARDMETRLGVCGKIFAAVEKLGIDPARIFFDPLVMPLATDVTQAGVTCTCIRRIKESLHGARTVVGLSNISHGLPRRGVLNQGFLIACLMHGLDAAIIDPTNHNMQVGLAVGKALAGKDRHCRGYARAFKQGLLG